MPGRGRLRKPSRRPLCRLPDALGRATEICPPAGCRSPPGIRGAPPPADPLPRSILLSAATTSRDLSSPKTVRPDAPATLRSGRRPGGTSVARRSASARLFLGAFDPRQDGGVLGRVLAPADAAAMREGDGVG